MISGYWKCCLVVPDQISYPKNAPKWSKKITQKRLVFFWAGRFQMMPNAKWTANLKIDGFCIQIGSKIPKILIFAQLSPTQKYIYT